MEAIKTIEIPSQVAETGASDWNRLYKTGGAAALLSVIFFPIQILVFMLNPPPDTVTGWFTLFQNNWLLGLLSLDLLLVVDQVLAMLIFLALYFALKRVSPSFMIIATTLALVSTLLFVASNPAFAMLNLSNQYTAAVTEAQRAGLLAAGQATLATLQGSAFHTSYLIGSVAAILISAIMLRSQDFGRLTANMGILGNVIALGLYVPRIGVYISVFSVVFLWVWYLLMARDLFRLGRTRPDNQG